MDKRYVINTRNDIYNKVIDNLCEYIKKYNLSDPIDIMSFLNKIIYSGCLSYKKEYKPLNISIEDLSTSSYQVILGNGVCRNINQFATDVFIRLGYDAYDIFCSQNSCVKHMITLVEYNGKSYYLDVFNNKIFNYKDNYLIVDNERVYNIFDGFTSIDKDWYMDIAKYYFNKRGYDAFSKCFCHRKSESIINEEIKDIKFNSKMFYKRNKKLYHKFMKTYL